MTFSIVARDPLSGALGVGVATKHLAAGALVPHARAGVGALATQAGTNPLYGPDGLALLAAGEPAAAVVERLTRADEGRAHRQLHVVDAAGRTAAWTGSETVPWAGDAAEDGVSVAGNMLAGSAVLTAMAGAYRVADPPFAARLLAALEAGEAAGGDKRGRQSAALYVVESEPYAAVDLRVDDHRTPLVKLRRLLAECDKRYVREFRARLPTRAAPHRF